MPILSCYIYHYIVFLKQHFRIKIKTKYFWWQNNAKLFIHHSLFVLIFYKPLYRSKTNKRKNHITCFGFLYSLYKETRNTFCRNALLFNMADNWNKKNGDWLENGKLENNGKWVFPSSLGRRTCIMTFLKLIKHIFLVVWKLQNTLQE